MDVLVAGGSGFVGRSLCRVLTERGHDVTAMSRSPDETATPPGVVTVAADITETDLTGVVAGHDAVVNLVALPSHAKPRGQTHEAVHLGGTRNLVAASERAGVDRFVQMSGLGVDSGVETAYFEAKRRGERVVRDSELEWVVYRPSVVFGEGCAFIPFIERTIPPLVAPLPGGGQMQIQPMWVEDLAPMLADGVTEGEHAGETYELGGPERLTFAETVQLIRPGVRVVSVPMSLSAIAFRVADVLPMVPFGTDQFRVLTVDNTTDNDVSAFGIAESDLLSLSAYLDSGQRGL
jgi:uncharacterized protein YbjT (DUF2867 family)